LVICLFGYLLKDLSICLFAYCPPQASSRDAICEHNIAYLRHAVWLYRSIYQYLIPNGIVD